MDEDQQDMDDAGAAHQQELESRRWQEELTADPGYFDWLEQLAASAVCEQERKYADYRY